MKIVLILLSLVLLISSSQDCCLETHEEVASSIGQGATESESGETDLECACFHQCFFEIILKSPMSTEIEQVETTQVFLTQSGHPLDFKASLFRPPIS